ncbi:MAG: hypothetical protein CMD33_10575, partial [Flavobacteriales bacterium]|nr:hypothetical protein [Flavobacteriales bacterium]
NMDVGGDVKVGGAAVINSTLDVRGRTTLHDSLQVSAPISVESTSMSNLVFSVDTLGNTYISGRTRITDSLFATTTGTRLAGLVADSTLLARLEVSGTSLLHNDVQMNDDLLIHDSLDVKGHVDLSDGASLTVSGASNFNSLITATGDFVNNGLITTDSIISDTLRSTLGSITRLEATTLEVNSRADRALFRGGLSAVNTADSSVFSVRATDDKLGKLALSGTMDIYSSVVDPSGLNPAPTDTVTINGAQGLLNASGWIKGSSFEAKSVGGLSRLRGSLQVDSLTTLTKGLNVFHTDTTSSNALFYVQNSGIELKRNTSLTGNLTLGNGNGLTLGTSGASTAASNLWVYGEATIDSLTVNGRINNGSGGSITTGSGTFAGGVTVSERLDVTKGLVVGRRPSYGYESNGSTSNFLAVFDAGGGQTTQQDGIVIRVDNGNSQANKNNNFVQFQNSQGQFVGEIRGDQGRSDWTLGKAVKKDQRTAGLALAATHLSITVIDQAVRWKRMMGQVKLLGISAFPDSWCCTFLLPIGCFIIPIPGMPMIDWGDLSIDVVEVLETTAKYNHGIELLPMAVKRYVTNQIWDALQNQAIDKDRGDYGGLSYASGNKDYAEWIPRSSDQERLRAGQIVGVINGEVSLRTKGASHLMVVSNAPIVTGNDSPANPRKDLEKIAFMGQVPVRVIGPVVSGDFILPSGDNDGYGIAVKKDELRPEEVGQVVGVAWESGLDSYMNTVNVAVGVDHNAEAKLFDALDDEMDQLAYEMSQFKASLLGERNPTVQSSTNPQEGQGTKVAKAKPMANVVSDSNSLSKPNTSYIASTHESTTVEQSADHTQLNHLPQFHKDQTAKNSALSAQEEYPEEFIRLLTSNFDLDVQSVDDLTRIVRSMNSLNPTVIPLMEAQESELFKQSYAEVFFNEQRITSMLRQSYVDANNYPVVPGSIAEKMLIQQVRDVCIAALEEL